MQFDMVLWYYHICVLEVEYTKFLSFWGLLNEGTSRKTLKCASLLKYWDHANCLCAYMYKYKCIHT